jgi:hypothetical protein
MIANFWQAANRGLLCSENTKGISMLAKQYLLSLSHLAVELRHSVADVEKALEALNIAPALNIDGRRYWDADAYQALAEHFERAVSEAE